MISPAQFIPVAEESSLILDIGHWVLETACRQLAAWGSDGQKCDLTLAVNVSARQFKSRDFVDEVAAVIKEQRIDPSLLKLELTESVVLENMADIVMKMHALKALGVKLSMDDFGTWMGEIDAKSKTLTSKAAIVDTLKELDARFRVRPEARVKS